MTRPCPRCGGSRVVFVRPLSYRGKLQFAPKGTAARCPDCAPRRRPLLAALAAAAVVVCAAVAVVAFLEALQ